MFEKNMRRIPESLNDWPWFKDVIVNSNRNVRKGIIREVNKCVF